MIYEHRKTCICMTKCRAGFATGKMVRTLASEVKFCLRNINFVTIRPISVLFLFHVKNKATTHGLYHWHCRVHRDKHITRNFRHGCLHFMNELAVTVHVIMVP